MFELPWIDAHTIPGAVALFCPRPNLCALSDGCKLLQEGLSHEGPSIVEACLLSPRVAVPRLHALNPAPRLGVHQARDQLGFVSTVEIGNHRLEVERRQASEEVGFERKHVGQCRELFVGARLVVIQPHDPLSVRPDKFDPQRVPLTAITFVRDGQNPKVHVERSIELCDLAT